MLVTEALTRCRVGVVAKLKHSRVPSSEIVNNVSGKSNTVMMTYKSSFNQVRFGVFRGPGWPVKLEPLRIPAVEIVEENCLQAGKALGTSCQILRGRR